MDQWQNLGAVAAACLVHGRAPQWIHPCVHGAGCKVVTCQSRCNDSAPPLLPPSSICLWLTPWSCAAELQDLLPGIINQLGPDNLANLKKLASQYQGAAAAGDAQDEEEEDDDVPDLVEGELTGSPGTHLS